VDVDSYLPFEGIPFYLHQNFAVRVARFPNYDRFLVDLDLGTFSASPVEELRVDVTLKDSAGRAVMSDTGRTVTNHSARLEYAGQGIAPGEYKLNVVVRRGTDELGQETLDFSWPKRAVWFDNRYGFDDVDNDRVPYPWSNMAVSGPKDAGEKAPAAKAMPPGTVSVWGRDYTFGDGLLPEQVTTLGAPMLRAPMRMRIRAGQEAEIDTSSLKAVAQWPKTDRTRVEGIRAVDTQELAITNTFWAEYDGLVWATLRVTPKEPLTVEAMEIEIPLRQEFSDVIMAGRLTGKLKPGEHHLRGDLFYTSPWLGNGDGGIQLFIDGDLRLQDRDRSIRIEVAEDGAATVHLKAIDVPTALQAPYEVAFGFIATPVRPKITRTPYFRESSLNGGGPFYPGGLESLPAPDPGYDPYGGGSKSGRLYVWTSDLSIAEDASGTSDFKDYGAEWMGDPFQRPAPRWTTQAVHPAGTKSFIDYFVWRHWRFQNKYGYSGLYYDNPNLGVFRNREVMKRLYNVTLANTFKSGREAALVLASNGIYNMAFGAFFSGQWNGEHLNSRLNANQPGYRGLIGPAEWRAEYMGHNWGWPVMFLGQARISARLAELAGGPEAVADHLQGLQFLHDAPPGTWFFPQPLDQVCSRAGNAYHRHGLPHWVYQFTPYWKQDLVTLPDTNMYASWYIARPSVLTATSPSDHMGYPWGHRLRTFRHYFQGHEYLPLWIHYENAREIEQARPQLEQMKDKAILIVYNDTAWEGEMRLKPDWTKLGLGAPETLKATNAVHSTGFRVEKTGEKDKDGKEIEKGVFFPRPEETAKIENGELVFPMTKFNYRMIVIEKGE
jgi:hypothetical protein